MIDFHETLTDRLADSPSKDPMAKRMEDTYKALREVKDSGHIGQQQFYMSKMQIEALMGLLSGEFEGTW